MPIDNWAKIQELFRIAADLPADGQGRFLDAACQDHPALRREVETLLASDRRGGRAISAAIEEAARELLGGDPLIGSRLGPWRVVREIDHGGMGTVYFAIRDDDFRQQAAVKLVTYGMDTTEVLHRFRHERQILAGLNHPFIARLIDGGTAPDGRPYLVMEYVEGRRIDAWCRDRLLGLEDRCRLFMKVCEALVYAHQNLVVHRDLKPGNILITSEGLPKLLDFGIASLLTPAMESGDAAGAGESWPVTPEYASPEQVLGQPVTTSTDIYSLGAVLYELLSGAKAHRPGSPSGAGVSDAIRPAELVRPSDSIPPGTKGAARLRRRLSGDLDNIVLMAMRKEPERRYCTVGQFASDLQNYLEDRPVAATSDSLAYRGRKFVRRHGIAVALAAVAGASLLAGIVFTRVEYNHTEAARRLAETQRQSAYRALQFARQEHATAQRERDTAVRESARAASGESLAGQRLTQIVDLANHSLFDIHSQIERLPGATEARRQIVRITLHYLESLSKDAAPEEPVLQALAAAYLKLGDVQGYPYGPNLGDGAGALKSYATATNLLKTLRQTRPRDPDLLLEWVELQRRIAVLMAGSGKVEEAMARLRTALPDAVLLETLRPNDPEAASRKAALYDAMAIAADTHSSSDVVAWSRRSLAELEGLALRFPGRETILEQKADAHSRLGVGLNAIGGLRQAMAEFQQGAELRERLVAAHPNDTVERRNLMLAYGHIAAVRGNPFVPNLGDPEGSRQYYRKAVALAEQTAAADPRDLTARYDVAAAMLRLGVVDVPPSGLQGSLDTLDAVAASLESLADASPGELRYKGQLAIAQEYRGHRLRDLARLPESIASFRLSLRTAESMLAIDKSSRPAFSQILASTRGLVLALAASGDRAETLREARAMITRTGDCNARFLEKRVCALYEARAWLALASAHGVFARSQASPAEQREADWRDARAAAEHAARDISAIGGSHEDAYYSAAWAESQALIAEAGGHLQ